jgi:hypothetical protein
MRFLSGLVRVMGSSPLNSWVDILQCACCETGICGYCSDNKVEFIISPFPSNKCNLMVRQGTYRLIGLRCPWFESCGVPFLSLERRFFLLARFKFISMFFFLVTCFVDFLLNLFGTLLCQISDVFFFFFFFFFFGYFTLSPRAYVAILGRPGPTISKSIQDSIRVNSRPRRDTGSSRNTTNTFCEIVKFRNKHVLT